MASSEARSHARLTTIAALGVTQIFAWGATYYLPAVLARPIAADTGWPLSHVMAGLSVGLFASGIVSPRIGRFVRDHGGRHVLLIGVMLVAAGLSLLGLATSEAMFFLAWLVLGCGMGATLYDAAFATLGRYYGYEARSAITALTLFGGFASTICWPLSAFLLERWGWRATCFVYAGLQLGLSLPLLWRFLPALARALPSNGSPGPARRDDPDARPGPEFIILAVILTLGGTIATTISVHLLAILGAHDVALAAAVALGALIGPSQVGARVFDMVVGKHLPAIATLAIATALIAIGVLALASGLPVFALALVLYGAGNGIWSIARGALPLALFGPDRFPVLMGRLAMPTLLAQSLAPPMTALVIERFGALPLVTALAAAAIINLGLVGLLWRVARGRSAQAAARSIPDEVSVSSLEAGLDNGLASESAPRGA
ncbi:MAG TPA: MFS transporter [Kaistia sp.]|nr:MFS transporter [Kaistia sp.]